MRKEAAGYFTVEAAMVMPVVLYLVFMIMYLMFFQYNRCLMELDVGIFAMRGTLLQVGSNEDRAQQLRKQALELEEESYMGWRCQEIQWKMKNGILQVEQQGNLVFPFTKESWDAEVSYENHILSPVSFLRYYRKLVGGKDDTDGIY